MIAEPTHIPNRGKPLFSSLRFVSLLTLGKTNKFVLPSLNRNVRTSAKNASILCSRFGVGSLHCVSFRLTVGYIRNNNS